METVERYAPPVPAPVAQVGVARPLPFLAWWAAAWAAAGAVIAVGIALVRGGGDLGPLLMLSVEFAEVVGLTALASSRLAFPAFRRLSFVGRLALQVVTVLAGTLFGSAAVVATQPLYALASPRVVVGIVGINAVLAFVVGIAIHTYDAMRRQIEESLRALRDKEALERELAIARDVQRELLPRCAPIVVGLELAGVCLPAVGVGGDAFDYIAVADGRVAVMVADVAGKGIPAALLMAGLQASVRSLAPYLETPGAIAARLNGMLQRPGFSARYATLFFALYDAQERTLRFTNCGHVPPLHVRADGVTRLDAGGLPLGLFEGGHWKDGTCSLKPGEMVALFTDGIVETVNAGGDEFGEQRVAEVLRGHVGRPLEEIVDAVLQARSRWSEGARPHDDVTLVLARAL